MADEKVNVSPEEKKAPEDPAPSGPGDPPAPEHTEGPAVPGGDQAAPSHAEPAAGEHTQQTVLPGIGEDAPASSGKVINLSDIQAADKGGKEASAPAPDKKVPEADKPPKRRGRPSKVDKAAREEAPPSVRDKVSRGKKADKGKETDSGGAPASKSAKTVKPGKAAPVKEAAVPPPEIKLPPTPEVPPRPVEEGKIVYLKMSELHPFHTFREHPYKVHDDMVTLCTQKYDMGDKTLYNLVTEAFPIVLFVKKLEDNSRRVMEITECEILEDGTRQLHTLYRYHVSETSIQDGKVKVHGEFQKVSTISASLQKRLLENGMPPRLLERIAGGGVKLDTGKEETA